VRYGIAAGFYCRDISALLTRTLPLPRHRRIANSGESAVAERHCGLSQSAKCHTRGTETRYRNAEIPGTRDKTAVQVFR